MPGSQIYEEYLKQGRILGELSWDYYGGESIVFTHPIMDPMEMYELNTQVLREGYTIARIMARTFHTLKNRPSIGVALNSFFTQLGLRKGFRQQYGKTPGKMEL